MIRALSPVLVAAIVAAGTTMPLGGSAEAQTRELRFAEFGPNRGTRAEGLKWLDGELRACTNGSLGLDITWGGALLDAKTAAQGLSDGVADMASIVPVYAPGKLVAYEVTDTQQFGDEWVGMMATYDFMTQNEHALEEQKKANIRYFGNYTTGPTQLLSRDKPVTTAADLEGMTIRATGAMVPALTGKGAATVSTPQPAVYEALSNGSVDGSQTYYYVVTAYKQYEVADYITELNMGQVLAFGIAMFEPTFQSLTPAEQECVTKLGREFTEHMAQKMFDSRTDTKAQLQAGIDGHVIEVVQPTPELRADLVAAAEADVANWIEKANEKGLPAEDVLADFKARVAAYEQEREEKGYPWAR